LFLSQMESHDLEKYLHGNPLVRYTANTIIDSDLYAKELLKVKQSGIATDDEEYISGVRAVAASIKKYGTHIPALWVVGFKASMSDKKMPVIIEQTQSAVEKISKKLAL
ncbi:MAG: IclR family transcriptional regulator C-terminal domain-containing protein, partial [Desulfobacula sp.]